MGDIRAKNFIDMKGRRYNYLTVIGFDRVENKRVFWKCLCDCGITTIKDGQSIRNNTTKSCGCYRHRKIKKGESGFNIVLAGYKRGAIERGHVFELDKDTFREIVEQDCHYCNTPPMITRVNSCKKLTKEAKEYGSYTHNGIDRMDNNKGYTVENSVPCCFTCNRGKSGMSYNDFINYIKRVRRKK